MNVNKPISRRKALKVMGLGMLAVCVPTLPSFGESPKKHEKRASHRKFTTSILIMRQKK